MMEIDSIFCSEYASKLLCLNCRHVGLQLSESEIVCRECNKRYPIIDDVPILLAKPLSEYEHIEPTYRQTFPTARRVTYKGLEHVEYCNEILATEPHATLGENGTLPPPEYWKRVYHDNPRLQKILAFMKQVVKDLGDDIKILDVGSGLGNDSYRIIKHFPSVSIVGLEIILGGAIVSQRNHRSPRLQYLCADATDIPFADETFDVVYSVNAIEHAGIEMTREMARVLKHGGRAFVVGPSHEHYKFLNLKGFVACLIKGRDFHSHGIPAQEYRLIFQQYFTITDYQADYFRFLQERHFWNRFSYGFVKGVFDFHRFGEEILSLSNFTKRYLMEQYFTLVKA